MANIELITRGQAPLLARVYFGEGDPSPIVQALAHVPEFLQAAMPFLGTVYGDSSVPERQKEIVVLRASARNACRYCVQTHTVVAWDAGLSADEAAALRGECELPPSFDERERALVAFTDALCDRPADAVRCLSGFFDEYQIVELVTVGSLTIMLNKFATALALPVSAATAERLQREGV